jgi:Vitamin-D-receptor interacting Mediator subunit 4
MTDLLSFAKRISKFTLPPNYRGPPAPEPKDDEQHQAITESEDVPMSNGITPTPAGDLPRSTETPTEAKAEPKASEEGRGALWDSLSESQRHFIDAVQNAEWVPWPSQELIKHGALGSIQFQIEQEEDPWKKLSPQQQEELERKKKEESERRAEEERRVRAEREKMRRESIKEAAPSGGPLRAAGEEVLEGIGIFGSDEDEDE